MLSTPLIHPQFWSIPSHCSPSQSSHHLPTPPITSPPLPSPPHYSHHLPTPPTTSPPSHHLPTIPFHLPTPSTTSPLLPSPPLPPLPPLPSPPHSSHHLPTPPFPPLLAWQASREPKQHRDEELVILLSVLAHTINNGYTISKLPQ